MAGVALVLRGRRRGVTGMFLRRFRRMAGMPLVLRGRRCRGRRHVAGMALMLRQGRGGDRGGEKDEREPPHSVACSP